MANSSRRAVFLDRDGTINEDVHYLRRVEDFRLLPGAAEAIARLNAAGWLVIVVTNQSGIARGYLNEDILDKIHERMNAELAAIGAYVDAIFYCPHHPDDGCMCRKPRPGLIEQAMRQFSLEPGRCWVIGDKPSDVETGQRAGCRTVLLARTGVPEECESHPDLVVPDLISAVQAILGEEEAADLEHCC